MSTQTLAEAISYFQTITDSNVSYSTLGPYCPIQTVDVDVAHPTVPVIFPRPSRLHRVQEPTGSVQASTLGTCQ